MIACLCINDDNKPASVPNEKWVQKNKEYTISFAMTVSPQKKLAFQLKEIDLDDSCAPYTWFLSSRFAIKKEDLQKLIIFIEECNGITLSVKQLMNQINNK